MPRKLASKKQYAGWIYRPNVSSPKSFKKWSLLVTDFMVHLISRYGREQVITWNFDFWTAPNLKIKEGYWYESRQDFFLFYRVTYHAVKNVDESIRLGSPNFSIPSGLDWYQSFFDYCRGYELVPAYISSHLYNCGDDISTTAENYPRFSNSWDRLAAIGSARDTGLKNMEALHCLLCENGLDHRKLIISDWNFSFIPRDFIRDTCFMAPYLIDTCIRSQGLIDTLCFRSLSDINEDFYIDQKPFHGGPGLMDFNGLKKASYYTFSILAKMGPDLLESGSHYLLTRRGREYQLLLFHFVDFDTLYAIDDHSTLSYKQRYNIYESSEELAIHAMLPLAAGSYKVKETRINRSCGSSYDLWLKTGAPEEMDASLISYIKKKGGPEIYYSVMESEGTLLLDCVLPPHGAALLEIIPC